MKGIDKDVNELVKKIEKQGWSVRISRGSHIRCQSPTGRLVFLSGSPNGGRRAIENMRRDLRNAGAEL